MAKFNAFFGSRVEVQYRAGDILLPATGTLVADSGKSIFLEEKFCQRGTVKQFRWEIPYSSIVSLNQCLAAVPVEAPAASASPSTAVVPSLVKHLKSRPGEA